MAENGGAPAPVVPYISLGIVHKILLCLPAADVHRCRFVCKGWRELISDNDDFIRTYRQRHPPMPLFFYRRDFNLGVADPALNPGIARVDLQAVDLAARESRLVLRFPDVQDPLPTFHILNLGLGLNELDVDMVFPTSVFWVEGSCDGILLLLCQGRLYLCNPWTRHWALLPDPETDHPIPYHIVAFYASGPPGEYRILYEAGHLHDPSLYWIRRIMYEQEDMYEIDGPPDPPGLNWAPLFQLGPAHHLPPAMLPGSLQWSFLFGGVSYILVFDTALDEFRWIGPPAEDDGGDQFIPWFDADAYQYTPWFADDVDPVLVFEMGGMLAMPIFNEAMTMVDVWVLHDPFNRAWVRRCSIHLPSAAMQANDGFQALRPFVYVVSQEPEVLVRCPYAMLQSGADGSVRQHYRRPHHWTIATRHMLEESFVPHALLSAQGNDDEPPFFLFQ